MNNIKVFVVAILIPFFISCGNHYTEKLTTRNIQVGDNSCIIQKMPASFQEGEEGGKFDYYRLIMESIVPVKDSSAVNYINFGMQDAVKMIREGDSIPPALLQRVVNGKKNSYEYIIAFEKAGTPKAKEIQISIDDKVLGIGKVSVQF